jgi:membrane protease subunit HflC
LIIEGEADAERTRILAEAFGADPEFFDFYRSLRAYETSIKAENSTLIIPPDHEFLNYLQSSSPRKDK